MRLPLWNRLRFEKKLLLVFLFLALAPTLFLVFLQIGRLERSIDLWETPGVEDALESSVALLLRTEREREAERDRAGAAVLKALVEEASAGGPLDAADAAERIRRMPGGADLAAVRVVHRDGADRETISEWGGPFGGNEPPGTAHTAALDDGGKLTLFLFFKDRQKLTDERRRITEGYRFYRKLAVYEKLERGKIWLRTALVLFTATVIALLVARGLSRSLSRPISSLVEGTTRVRRGDLDVRIDGEGSDEIGRLVRSFNRMARELKESREKLIRAERVAAWGEAARRIAHEIRNPLTPITLSLHRLGRRTAHLSNDDRAVVEECLRSILEEVEALKKLAEEFSLFARLPAPKISPFDVNDLLRSVVPLYTEGTEVDVEWRLDGEDLVLPGDRELLRSVFSNLVKNAVEAMERKGRLAATSGRKGKNVFVAIADSGPGIAPEERERVFHPYYTTKRDGTGLGLALAERIVHDQGGSLSVEESAWGGALFRVVFPGGAPLPPSGGESTMDEGKEGDRS